MLNIYPALTRRSFPSSFPKYFFLSSLGPGMVLLALSQGSGELIWWPYLISRYGLGFLFLLLPACAFQFPVFYELGRYTILTGESALRGFSRVHMAFATITWFFFTVCFLWFGAYASAGGTALAELTQFPGTFSDSSRSLFWGSVTIAVFFILIMMKRGVYSVIEWVMAGFATVTIVILISTAVAPQEVRQQWGPFIFGMFSVEPLARPWDSSDAKVLLSALLFAGLGGFWNLFYSYWFRAKGVGMAGYNQDEFINPEEAYLPEDAEANRKIFRRWIFGLRASSIAGVFGNWITTALVCLLAYVYLTPQGDVPNSWKLAVVQSKILEGYWGWWGQKIYLLIAAGFLCDTWLTTTDAVAKVHVDFLRDRIPALRKISGRSLYHSIVLILAMITFVTMLGRQPGILLLLTAVLNALAMIILILWLLYTNFRWLPNQLPIWARPSRLSKYFLFLALVVYTVLFVSYMLIEWQLIRI